MLEAMRNESFGGCTFTEAWVFACPEDNPYESIAELNRE
jgi:hypothetical protein